MKWLKVFSVFAVLNVAAWSGAHWYRTAHPTRVLLVADTSYALKTKFDEMQQWIDNYQATSRYSQIMIGTDKSLIGPLEDMGPNESIFRVSFGRSTPDSLKQYRQMDADVYLFLSDGSFEVPGWDLKVF